MPWPTLDDAVKIRAKEERHSVGVTNPFPIPQEPFPSSLLVSPPPSVLLACPEGVGVLVQRAPDELGLLPEVGGEEAVGVGDGNEGGLEGVLERLGRASRGGVGVLDTSELEETLDGGGGDEASTTGGGDELSKQFVSRSLFSREAQSFALSCSSTPPTSTRDLNVILGKRVVYVHGR